MKRALITGITGQDGSYLADLLVEKGYEVHGLVRHTSIPTTQRIAHLLAGDEPRIALHYGDLSDGFVLQRLVHRIRPDEIYNLGAQSHVAVSFEVVGPTTDVTGMGVLRMLETVRTADWPVRFYQAGSSEMYGKVREVPQTEATPFAPQSPYATAKVFGHHMTQIYRDAYGLYACNGMLFNHESPRRGANFLTRKVTLAVADILAGRRDHLALGNLDAMRDWGYAPEYVEAMWRMLQQDRPDDYVIATGETHSVQEWVEHAFRLVGRDWHDHVSVDPDLFRPAEVDYLIGDASHAARTIGWTPATKFDGLLRIMLAADLAAAGVDPYRYPELAESAETLGLRGASVAG